MEESMAVSQKTKHEINIQYSNFTAGNVLILKHKLKLIICALCSQQHYVQKSNGRNNSNVH